MTNPQALDRVRKFLDTWRQQHGADEGELRESILIHGGTYCGRRFHFGDYAAIWFVEEDELKITGPDGGVVATHSFAPTSVRRRAA